MPSKVTDVEDLEEITYNHPGEQLELDGYSVAIMENEQIDTRRWVSAHRVVWCENHDGENEYYAVYYDKPLTEMQEAEPPYLDDIHPVTKKTEIKEIVTYV